jgi:hypothetical protein
LDENPGSNAGVFQVSAQAKNIATISASRVSSCRAQLLSEMSLTWINWLQSQPARTYKNIVARR